jgi:hypothetical protein
LPDGFSVLSTSVGEELLEDDAAGEEADEMTRLSCLIHWLHGTALMNSFLLVLSTNPSSLPK